jgi:hypothetical protein
LPLQEKAVRLDEEGKIVFLVFFMNSETTQMLWKTKYKCIVQG